MAYRLGVDIGGTFTDLSLLHEETGELIEGKVPSTPSDPAQGFIDGVRQVVEKAAIAPAEISLVVHGTTVVTNSLLERSFEPAGLVVTRGYRGILEYARSHVKGPFGTWLFYERPPRVVPLERVREATERSDAHGAILKPLDEEEIAAIAREYREDGIDSVGVSLLWSFKNPAHERRIKAIFAEVHPDCDVLLSSEVLPEIREYERTFTVAASAALKPRAGAYVARVESLLRAEGVQGRLLCMKSSGGVISAEEAASRPMELALSGPAAGVLGMAQLCDALGFDKAVTIDMGGTSTDLSFIEGGRPLMSTEGEINEYPIRVPMIEIHTIGAGGGSIAWLGPGNKARVGPRSSGAVPGPACYRRGGTEATVTDANVVLGRLGDTLLDGGMTLDRDAACESVERFGAQLGLGLVEAAVTIVELAIHNMQTAIREVSTRKGRDPRECVLVAFGGAGPGHAGRLAELLEMPAILYPHAPGIASTTGLLGTDVRRDFVRSLLVPAGDAASLGALAGAHEALVGEADRAMDREGIRAADRDVELSLDFRYSGQQYTVTVPVAGADGAQPLTAGAVHAAIAAFHAEHRQLCGFDYGDDPAMGVELVNLRLAALGRLPRPRPQALAPAAETAAGSAITRPVWFEAEQDFIESPVLHRRELLAGHAVDGPAIIEDFESTIVLPPGQRAVVDETGNIVVTVGAPGRGAALSTRGGRQYV